MALAIIVATGTGDGKTVEDYLVPAGATFAADVPGTTAVDVSGMKVVSRQPIGEPGTQEDAQEKGYGGKAGGCAINPLSCADE